ncbi:uncharacterized protein LOC129584853 isoform X2 [Paramacrobiotus metropolitanus]|uniref:uncharacterized protein LOC129584853 isoform X2 n=1 Tax=Paramacrobiotus metropolitanus TaxID=2943436 RepID=UPI0024455FCE|nr:uncharacterized protein LOC129584853 isoform X2 [Paramacrobiotus metropolitanus]
MVTTTTKTLNYSIIRGNHTNSVNATITSTPGFNVNYFGKIPGILKLVELMMVIVALALVASLREDRQLTSGLNGTDYLSYPREMFLSGEVYFLCAQTLALGVLTMVLLTYAFHTVSSMIIPKATALENTFNMTLAILLLIAGIVEIVQTEQWKISQTRQIFLFTDQQYGKHLAAGIISLVTGVCFLASFALSQRELQGPKPV